MFFCPQISQISQIFIAARWFLSPTDYTDYTDFRLRFFATLKILFCLGKSLTYNKIRYLTASNALYGFTQILSLCDGFLDGLEELGRCAALDFVILVFRQDMVAFGILICKDNNFF